MPICVSKRGNENEARFLHQNEVNLRDRETIWPPTYLFRMHLHRQPNANTKLDLRSPIVDRDYHVSVSESFQKCPLKFTSVKREL